MSLGREDGCATPGSHCRVNGNVNHGAIRTNGLQLLDLRTECALSSNWLRTVFGVVWTQLLGWRATVSRSTALAFESDGTRSQER